MMAHNVYAGFVQGRAGYVQANTAEVLMIALVSDQMVMPAPGRELSDELKSSYVAIESACGHMGSVCDADQIADIIHSFMP